MKKIIILLAIILQLWNQVSANNIEKISQNIFSKNETKNIYTQIDIYETYIYQLKKIIRNNSQASFLQDIINLESIISNKYDSIVSDILQKKAIIQTGNTLILKFWEQTNIPNYISKNSDKLLQANSVFIFRESKNISSDNMKIITSEIKKITPNILIFTDQEGGQINRFISFKNGFNFEDYREYMYIFLRFETLKPIEKESILKLFWNDKYFPEMWNIWKTYKNISKENKKKFLEIITFIQLKNLQIHWINTHGFIADLDLWNPVISWLNRSFSENILEYFSLIDAYVSASKQTGVILYAKHFPGHWAGNIDSHKDILDYSENTQYVENNLLVFEYFLNQTKLIWKWIMVWHMYLDKNISEKFHKILSESDFIITDDLAMQWFKKIKDIPDNKIFSTQEIINYKNLIKINTQDNIWIK